VIVAGAAGIEARHDGAEGIAPLRVVKTWPRRRSPYVVFASVVRMPRSTSAFATGRHARVSTTPESSTGRPAMPPSRRSLRRGDFGLKNGPSISGRVGASPVVTRWRRREILGQGVAGWSRRPAHAPVTMM